MQSKRNLLIFDLDGTLTSLTVRLLNPVIKSIDEILGFHPDTKFIHSALNGFLHSISEKSYLLVPKILWGVAQDLQLTPIQSVKFLLSVWRRYNRSKYTFEFLEGAQETLLYACNNYKVAIVTSASRKVVNAALQQLPMLKQVDAIITNDDVKNPKPHPEGLLRVCEVLQVRPDQTVYIGDLHSDIETGQRAGVTTVAFLGEYGEYTVNLLKEMHPDFLVETHADLLYLLHNRVSTISYTLKD